MIKLAHYPAAKIIVIETSPTGHQAEPTICHLEKQRPARLAPQASACIPPNAQLGKLPL
jgi:hypothetical protein